MTKTEVTTTATQAKPQTALIRNVLLANDLFSTAFGLLFLFGAGWVADFAGVAWEPYFRVLGIGLLLFAGFVFYTSRTLNRRLIWTVFALDVAWVVGSVLLLAFDLLPITVAAKWAFVFIADAVLVLVVLEYWGLRRMSH